MARKGKPRPLRIFFNKKLGKYYVLINGKKSYIKKSNKNKRDVQKDIAKKATYSINMRSKISKRDRPSINAYNIRPLHISDIIPIEETDEGKKLADYIESKTRKDLDFPDQLEELENKILSNKKLLPEEEEQYPVIKDIVKSKEHDKKEPSVHTVSEPEEKKTPKAKVVKKKSKKSIQELFDGKVPDLGPHLRPDVKEVPIDQMDNNAYARMNPLEKFDKEFSGTGVTHNDVPIRYWYGPNGRADHLYPLVDAVKYVIGIKSLEKLHQLFDDQPFGIDAKDNRPTILRKALYQFTPANVKRWRDNKDLKSVIRWNNTIKYGSGTKLPALYSDEIEDFFDDEKTYPEWGGVISSDQIDELPKKFPIGFVMNLDKSNQKGSHWVAAYISNDAVEYFDPFGKEPSDSFKIDIQKFIKKLKVPVMMKLKVNKVQRQHGNSIKCGYHSMRFLDDRFSGVPFEKATGFRDIVEKDNDNDTIPDWENGENAIKKEFSYI